MSALSTPRDAPLHRGRQSQQTDRVADLRTEALDAQGKLLLGAAESSSNC
jgi:hypothetical protein